MSDSTDPDDPDRPHDSGHRRDPPEDSFEESDASPSERRPEHRADGDGRTPRTNGDGPRTNGDAGRRRGPPRDPRGHPKPIAPGQAGDAPRSRGDLERELLRLENGAADIDRPYLTTLPEAFAAEELLFEWLGGLQETAGLKRASEALEYYAEVGWVSPDAAAALREYLLGLDLDAPDPRELDADDHLESLAYVARLARLAEREATA